MTGATSSRRFETALLYAVIAVGLAITLLPFLWVASGSLRSTGEIMRNPGAWFPERLTIENFVALFERHRFLGYLINSSLVSVLTVLTNVGFGAMVGYALGKLEFRGKRLVYAAVLCALMVPLSALFVPQFIVTVKLGLANSLFGVAAPMLLTPISIFIFRQYVISVPDELLEAARLDGAGEFRVFAQFVLPMCRPALATIAVMSFLASWNNFLWPLIIAQDEGVYTLPVGLAVASRAANRTEFGLLLAGAVVILLPVLILFLVLQRQFAMGFAGQGVK